MYILKAKDLSKEWNGKVIFKDANIEISEGEHVALLGRNGIGKTTLLHILLDKINADQGTIQRKYKPAEWGVIEQVPVYNEKWTLLDYVQSSIPELTRLNKQIKNFQALASDELKKVEEQFNEVYQKYLDLDGYSWELEVENQLSYFGFHESFWNLPFKDLSGGQKTLAQLAKALLKDPKFLVLDEPTNHIDQETLTYLMKWMNNYSGSLLFISHDRFFLDQVANFIYELTPEGTKRYKGGYSDYRQQKDLYIKSQLALYEKQHREKKELEETIRRFYGWFTKASNAASVRDPNAQKNTTKHIKRIRAKEKDLERLEERMVKKPEKEKQINFNFENSQFDSRTLVQLNKVNFSYDNSKELIKDITFSINRGDHIGVIGRNGTGKSTLLKIILDELKETSGEIYRHPELKVGYFTQEINRLSSNETIYDSLLEIPGMTTSSARTLLANFMFRKDDVFKKIENLSMGEKCRVAFVKLYFSNANLLVLDEPTNYLDIITREKIEEVLQHYHGAFIVVSHDRYLLEKTTNKIIDLENENHLFEGGYAEYMEHKEKQENTPHTQEQQNKLTELQLELTNIINREPTEDKEEQEEILEEIKRIKEQIDFYTQSETP